MFFALVGLLSISLCAGASEGTDPVFGPPDNRKPAPEMVPALHRTSPDESKFTIPAPKQSDLRSEKV
jgi:hypothetical protein